MYQRYSNSDRREEGERADHLTITLAHSEAVYLFDFFTRFINSARFRACKSKCKLAAAAEC